MTQKDIQNSLKKYLKDDVVMIYRIITNALLSNCDLQLWMMSEESIAEDIIRDEIGKAPSIICPDEFAENERELLNTIIETPDSKLTKPKMAKILADIVNNSLLFECLCTVISPGDTIFPGIMSEIGCGELFREVSEERVCRKRREYLDKLLCYVNAATNLYGSIHISELVAIIKEFEGFDKCRGYSRRSGAYQDTTYYSPKWLGIYTLRTIINSNLIYLVSSLDGFVAHECFMEEFQQESEDFGAFCESKGEKEITEDDLREFFEERGDISYRRLIDIAGQKDMFLPEKEEFLKYDNPIYIEETREKHDLIEYFLDNHMSELENVLEEDYYDGEPLFEDVGQIVDDIVCAIWQSGNHRDLDFDAMDHEDIIKEAIEIVGEYNIFFKNSDEANEFLKYLVPFINSIRLWVNNGHSPNELASLLTGKKPDKIVPMSSEAANLLRAGKGFFEEKGIDVDFEAEAEEVPVYPEIDGKVVPFTTMTQKVYPNDPCPCGSGKKYKKCCGKK